MRIVLKATHTHAGTDYAVGDEIDIPDGSAQWLIDLDRADKVIETPGKGVSKQLTKSEGKEHD